MNKNQNIYSIIYNKNFEINSENVDIITPVIKFIYSISNDNNDKNNNKVFLYGNKHTYDKLVNFIYHKQY